MLFRSLLNFEDPDDMLAKQAMVASELQKRLEVAQKPGSSNASDAPGNAQRTAREAGSGQPKVE